MHWLFKLPQEIFDEICNHISTTEFLGLRLLCREAGLHLGYSRLSSIHSHKTYFFTDRSLRRLTNLCHNDGLRRMIEHITFDCTSLKTVEGVGYRRKDIYLEAFEYRDSWPSKRPPFVTMRDPSTREARRILLKQKFSALSFAFQCLPNLRVIDFTDNTPETQMFFDKSELLRKIAYHTIDGDLMASSHTSPLVYEGFDIRKAIAMTEPNLQFGGNPASFTEVFLSVVGAACHAKLGLEEIRINPILTTEACSITGGTIQGPREFYNNPSWKKLAWESSIGKTLVRLDVCIPDRAVGFFGALDLYFFSTKLTSIIRSIKELRASTKGLAGLFPKEFGWGRSIFPLPQDFANDAGELTFPALEVLRLHRANTNLDDLLAFFMSHQSRLREFHATEMWIIYKSVAPDKDIGLLSWLDQIRDNISFRAFDMDFELLMIDQSSSVHIPDCRFTQLGQCPSRRKVKIEGGESWKCESTKFRFSKGSAINAHNFQTVTYTGGAKWDELVENLKISEFEDCCRLLYTDWPLVRWQS